MNDALDALRYLDPGMPREQWVRVAFAAKDAGITEDEFVAWSEGAANFNLADARSTFRNAKPMAGGVTSATLFKMARDAGYNPESKNEHVAMRPVAVGGNGAAGAVHAAPVPVTDPNPVWNACQPAVGHAYLTRKAIKPHGARMSSAGWLVVPYYNRARELQTVQSISADGTKRFLAGAKAKGSVAILGVPQGAPVVVVAEGFATAAAIEEATGYPTLAAGSRVSFPEAAKIARHFSPNARVVIAADRGDLSTPIAAARAVGAFLAVPGPEDAPEGFDFADWRLSGDHDAEIRARMDHAPPVPTGDDESRKLSAPRMVATDPGPDDGTVGPYLLDGKRRIIPNFSNVAAYLSTGNAGLLRRDAFTGVVTWRGLPMGEFAYLDMLKAIQGALIAGRSPFVKVPVGIVMDAIQMIAESNAYNSNVEWLDALAAWDQVPRIDTFFVDVVGTDATPYLLAVGRYFWLGMVSRMVEPGTKVDAAIALVGPQGIGKSSLARIIGGERHGEVGLAHIGERDWCAQLRGKIVVEIAELSGHSRAELESIKAVLTRTHDEYRSAYARTASLVPRGCVFMATTNERQFLIDASGNRRWLPIVCPGALTLEHARTMRDQLFAEAYALVRKGLPASWYVIPDAAMVQDAHVARDPWVELLDDKLRGIDGALPETITNVAIYDLLKIPADRQSGGGTGRRINAAMRALGFDALQFRINDGKGPVKRGFVRSGSDDS